MTDKDTSVPEDNQTQELALITNVIYGYHVDHGVGLLYGLQLLGGNAILFMDAGTVNGILAETKLNNVMSLKGRPCSVNLDENKTVTFDKLI